jgi:polyhydroxyalkanoate synthesis repressor PhaR
LVTTKKAASSASADSSDSKASPKLRIIKKYPNRRLYDTVSSAYITLAEVKQLVIDGKPFAVLDAKTSENLTRSILCRSFWKKKAAVCQCFLSQHWPT